MHARPLLEGGSKHRTVKLLPTARKLKYFYYTKSFKSKVSNLVYKPVFEQKACCLQTGRDMTTITALVSASVRSFIHTMCENRHVPPSLELTSTHRGLCITQRYNGRLSRDNAKRRTKFQGLWTDIQYI